MAEHNEFGKEGEEEAAAYLIDKGILSATGTGIAEKKNWILSPNIGTN